MGCVLASSCPIVNTVYLDNGVNKYCCTTDLCNNQLSLRSMIPSLEAYSKATRSFIEYELVITLAATVIRKLKI